MQKVYSWLSIYPKSFLGILFCVTLLLSYYAFFSDSKVRVDFSLEQMFPENDSERDRYEIFKKEFSREDDKFLLIYGPLENPFSDKNIKKVRDITDELEWIDGVESVLSLSNIDESDLYEGYSDEEIVQNIVSHPIYRDLIISSDGRYGALFVDLSDEVVDQKSREIVFSAVDEIIDIHRDWSWHEAGIPVMRTRYVELVVSERSIFVPLCILVVTTILMVIFRQPKYIFISIIAMLTTLVWVSALMAYLDISINLISWITYILLLVIGCSNAIHILMKYHETIYQENEDREKALHRVFVELGGALFLTSFTTSVGFYALMITNIRITQEFGFIVGTGVVMMFLFTISIITSALRFISVPEIAHINRLVSNKDAFFVNKIVWFNKNYSRLIMVVSSLLFILTIFGISKVDYNISVLDDLQEGNKLYDNFVFVDENFGGTLPLELLVYTDGDEEVYSREFLDKVDAFEMEIESIPEISKSISICDHLKAIMKNQYPDSGFVMPATTGDIKLYMRDYEYTDMYVGDEGKKTRLSCRIKNLTSDDADLLKEKIENIFSKYFSPVQLEMTGSTLLTLRTTKFLVSDLTNSFILAFIIIFFAMIIQFRSVRLSLISLFPNIIPLLTATAFMGFMGIKLRPSTAMTFSIALGIAVDDTIHFLARYKQELEKNGGEGNPIENTVLSTGRAIIGTTFVLCIGFFTLYFSAFVPNHEFGIIASVILVFAMICSLILLPVLLARLNRK